MFVLNKNNWPVYQFSEIAEQISERIDPAESNAEIYVGLEHIEPNSIHIKEYGKPSDVKGTKLKVSKGDIIFGKRRAYQRKAAIADFDGICSAHAMVLRPKPNVMIPELFPFFLHSDAFMNRAIDVSEGSLSPTIKWKILAKQKFTIPPLAEQKKLADLLWAGDKLAQKYNKLLSTCEAFIESLFFNINKGQYKNISLQDLTIAGSEGLRRGPFGSALRKEFFKDSGFKVYEQSNVINNNFETGTYFIDEVKFVKLKNFIIQPEDILVSCSGTVGKVAVFPKEAEAGIMNQALLRIRLSDDVDPLFFKLIFESKVMQRKLLKQTQGSAMKNLVALKLMKKIQFPIPLLAQQLEIVNSVKKLNSLNTMKENFDHLEKALIDQIFS